MPPVQGVGPVLAGREFHVPEVAYSQFMIAPGVIGVVKVKVPVKVYP